MPLIMVVCDGFLLAWVLTELREAGFDDAGEDRFHPAHALELMPAACLGCLRGLAGPVCGDPGLPRPAAPADLGRGDVGGPIHPLAVRLGPDRPPGCLAGRPRAGGSRGVEPRLAAARRWGGSSGSWNPRGASRPRPSPWPELAACVLAGLAYRWSCCCRPPAGCFPPRTATPITRHSRRALDARRTDRAGSTLAPRGRPGEVRRGESERGRLASRCPELDRRRAGIGRRRRRLRLNPRHGPGIAGVDDDGSIASRSRSTARGVKTGNRVQASGGGRDALVEESSDIGSLDRKTRSGL